jgi:hypothetical protein
LTSIKKKDTVLQFPIGEKIVLWIPEVNKYVLVEPAAAGIIKNLVEGKDLQQTIRQFSAQYKITLKEASVFVKEIKRAWNEKIKQELAPLKKPTGKKTDISNSVSFSKKTYRINQVEFCVEYETADAEMINHPKFAHLEIQPRTEPDHHFRISFSNGLYELFVNGQSIGSWTPEDSHFLAGKFSMQIIEKIYTKPEDHWLGVFHAAGISNGKKCMIFFGDSGSGKSTLSALLMANGLDILSDDFLPVESSTTLVYRFPSAISIKKQAFDIIIPQFPELKNTEEFYNPAFQKTFRYLTPHSTSLTGVTCKAIVLVKYDGNVDFQLEKMEPGEAFAQLVPDSWIYPSKQNAKRFLEWFAGLEHYRLTYSNNKKMIETVKSILNAKPI